MRMFKVFRMKRVKPIEEEFPRDAGRFLEYQGPGNVPPGESMNNASGKCAGNAPGKWVENAPGDYENISVVLKIDASEAYRVYDRFEEEEIVKEDDGFLIRMNCMIDDWIYGLILSFGPSAEVIEPPWMRAEMERRIREMLFKYSASMPGK